MHLLGVFFFDETGNGCENAIILNYFLKKAAFHEKSLYIRTNLLVMRIEVKN